MCVAVPPQTNPPATSSQADGPTSFPFADGIEDVVTQHLKNIYVASHYEDLMITKAVRDKLRVGECLRKPGNEQPKVSAFASCVSIVGCR